MGTKTILNIVNEARVGSSLPQVTSLFGATVRRTRTVEFAEAAILDTIDDFLKYPWTGLETLATITTSAADESYPLPADFHFMLTETYWSQGSPPTMRGSGPMSKETWRYFKNWGGAGSLSTRWRIQGDQMIIFPVPVGEVTHQYDYISKNICYGVGGYLWGSFSWGQGVWTAAETAAGYKSAFTKDTDTFKLDDDLLKKGIRWRLLKLAGLPYAADRAEYERDMDIAKARDDGGPGRIGIGRGDPTRESEFSNVYPIGDVGI